MNVFSNITEILRQKMKEPPKQTPFMKSIEIKELVDDAQHEVPDTFVKTLKTPVEAPEPNLIAVDETEEQEDDLPSLASLSSLDTPKKTSGSPQPSEQSSLTPDIDLIQVKYVHLVHQSKYHALLVKQKGTYTFPILAIDQSPDEVQQLASKHSAQPIFEPLLDSAYLVVNVDTLPTNLENIKSILKSTIIQMKEYDGMSIHPSVWGFYGLYPAMLEIKMKYAMRRIEESDKIPAYIQDEYEVYLMEEDAKRMKIDGKPIEYSIGTVGYIDDDGIRLKNKIDNFIKEYNTVDTLCVRTQVAGSYLSIWIPATTL